MNLAIIREALHAQPFKPFTMRLADGRSEYIKHPDFVATTPGVVVVVREDYSILRIEPLLIVSLDEAAPQSKGNGKSKKRRNDS